MGNNFSEKIFNPFYRVSPKDFQTEIFKASLDENFPSKTGGKNKYQVVILGAGKGTRLGVSYPKVLYELNYPNGRMSLLCNAVKNIKALKSVIDIDATYLVIDREKKSFFDKGIADTELKIIELKPESIRGTAVSIYAVLPFINPNFETIFLWGDLALWRVADLATVVRTQYGVKSCLAFCTRVKKSPYVAFLRTDEGVISSVIHANEIGRYPDVAEQDCLSFVCTSKALSFLGKFIELYPSSGEVDFVHFIPFLSRTGLPVIGLPIVQEGTVYGLNTHERATEINRSLGQYSRDSYIKYFQDPMS